MGPFPNLQHTHPGKDHRSRPPGIQPPVLRECEVSKVLFTGPSGSRVQSSSAGVRLDKSLKVGPICLRTGAVGGKSR